MRKPYQYRESSFDIDNEQAIEPAKREMLDPARVAARVMLESAYAGHGLMREQLVKAGVVVQLELFSNDWVPSFIDAWRDQAENPRLFENGFQPRFNDPQSDVYFAADSKFEQGAMEEAADHFAFAVSSGRACVGMSTEAAWLPRDLVNAADFRIAVAPLSTDDLRRLLEIICSKRRRRPKTDTVLALLGDHLATLTPRLLRLARRPGQDAYAYLKKLAEVVEWEKRSAPATSTHSPRDTPTLDRLNGMDEAVLWGRSVAADIQSYRAGKLPWAAVDRGCLLSGPPGVGKTLFARALAATCEVDLVTGSWGIWQSAGHQGDCLRSMRKSFAKAHQQAPSILFIDEVDSFPDRRKPNHNGNYVMQVTNALLAELDGAANREGIVVIAACNHADMLDPALIRSGRLDRHIQVGLPDRDALARILREHLGGELADVDLSEAATAAAGATGADCERYVRGAQRRARQAGRSMAIDDLLLEIIGSRERSGDELLRTAVHEAGHAILSEALKPDSVRAISLRDAGTSGGVAASFWGGTSYLCPSDVHKVLVARLAGRAAEEVVFGEPSSGAGGSRFSDLAGATRMATLAVSAWGFDPVHGLAWTGDPEAVDLPRAFDRDPLLLTQVEVALDKAYAAALDMLREREAVLRGLAAILVRRMALDGDEVLAAIAELEGCRQATGNRPNLV